MLERCADVAAPKPSMNIWYGFQPYRAAVCGTLSDRSSVFAQLIKVYGQWVDGEARYSPVEVVDTEVVPVFGAPESDRILRFDCGTPEPNDQNADAPFNAPYQCLSKK